MRKSLWVGPCPSCGTNNLVADNERNVFLKALFWFKVLVNGALEGFFYDGSSAATCRQCGFHQDI